MALKIKPATGAEIAQKKASFRRDGGGIISELSSGKPLARLAQECNATLHESWTDHVAYLTRISPSKIVLRLHRHPNAMYSCMAFVQHDRRGRDG